MKLDHAPPPAAVGLFHQQTNKEPAVGLTIHYRLKSTTRSQREARRLIGQLRQHALDLPFESVGELVELKDDGGDFESLDRDDPNRWLLIQAGQYVERIHSHYRVTPKCVIAFSAWPGQGCEESNFGLCKYPGTMEVDGRRLRTGLSGWCWSSFCKTQYASNAECGGIEHFLRCHLSVIRLLDHAANLGVLEEVSDEGEFFEKRDVQALVHEVGEWNEGMAAFVGGLNDQFGGDFIAPITDFQNFEQLEAKGKEKK